MAFGKRETLCPDNKICFLRQGKILEALNRGEAPFQADDKTGESFVAKGLMPKPKIDFEVRGNTPNARRKIRALVDAALILPDVPLSLPVVPPPL